MALGDALAVVLLERRGFTAEQFSVFHPGGKLGHGHSHPGAVLAGRAVEGQRRVLVQQVLEQRGKAVVLVQHQAAQLLGGHHRGNVWL